MSTELISFKREDGTEVPAYATAAGPTQGLVVLQEWWGVNEQVKITATNIAQECGVRVAIPDLYRTKIAYEAAEAQHLMSGLDWPGAVSDVKAAVVGLKAAGCTKVAVVGFCMGGALSLGSAVQHPEIDACIAFYGWNDGLADVGTMTKPTQCHFGKLDDIKGFSDADTAAILHEKLKGSGCPLEFYMYEKQGHGFMNGTDWGKEMQKKLGRPEVQTAEIDAAMARVKAFLAKHLN
eukprot:CAMPEP_0179436094 /NCGR_PEP_ID=MMETSP0799-20121207/20110_1 /TAXON_ID=46947 /ORGANISM="Geminigera cryophila, Strain CCMP2564" /LENGTH=235 /DNA_ID=CAMNT_0021215933 /DNA_START=42 /DNA_END=749 /DNA_ORIENTATION=+